MERFRHSDLRQVIDRATARHGNRAHCALQVCIDVQAQLSCVPPAAVPLIARATGSNAGHITSLISFYTFLHDTPRGAYNIYISDNITDRMQGSDKLTEQLCLILGVSPGQPRLDDQVTVTPVSCIGLGDQGPAGLVNGRPLVNLNKDRVTHIAQLIEDSTPLNEWPQEYFRVDSYIRRRDLLLEDNFEPGSGLNYLAQHSADHLLDQLDIAGLNGRGGAGFKTATKWRMCRDCNSDERFVVCNADEGEPGTFKDRVLLAEHADEVIEGMTLCALSIGANRGFIYLRGEYAWLLPHLEWVLKTRRGNNLLGQHILGHTDWHFDVEIHLGAGAYICGEESALIESLEGKRGTPRNRPPYPVTHGYMGKPTVVNNVETFVAVSHIAAKGGAWFSATGNAMGTKLHSVSGDCQRPGIYEFPVGCSIADILCAAGAENAKAVQLAGAAGELILADEFDRCIDLKTLRSGGSFMVFGPERNLFDAVQNFTHFFAHETCGFCAPCRTGTQLVRSVVDRMANGNAFGRDREAIDRLINVTPVLSHCGLGGTALNAIQNFRDKCPADYEQLFHDCSTQVLHFDLEQEFTEINNLTGKLDANHSKERLDE